MLFPLIFLRLACLSDEMFCYGAKVNDDSPAKGQHKLEYIKNALLAHQQQIRNTGACQAESLEWSPHSVPTVPR